MTLQVRQVPEVAPRGAVFACGSHGEGKAMAVEFQYDELVFPIGLL